MVRLAISATNDPVTIIGMIVVVAVLTGIIILVRWGINNAVHTAADAVHNASRRRKNVREGDNTDYVANKFRDVVLTPELKAAIDKVPNRPPQPGDRQAAPSTSGMGVVSPQIVAPVRKQRMPERQLPIQPARQQPTLPQQPSQSRYCTHCGAQLNPIAQFCARCGKPAKSVPGMGDR